MMRIICLYCKNCGVELGDDSKFCLDF
ncbi:MAG: zinc-ribbon domain-containing protein [Methanobrevibacter sp.]|nr:zinc-ribbon domain-containing protein [Methanobrevibacter sp.]